LASVLTQLTAKFNLLQREDDLFTLNRGWYGLHHHLCGTATHTQRCKTTR
jgi:hypothetical protein